MKVSIIGAGISGLASGIHALNLGHDVTIYEKNAYIGGTYNSSILNKFFIYNKDEAFYKDLGIDSLDIDESDYLVNYKDLYLYKDLTKLEEQFDKKSEHDATKVNNFIKIIKQCMDYHVNFGDALDLRSFSNRMKLLFKQSPNAKIIKKCGHYNIREYLDDFADKDIADLLSGILPTYYPAYVLFLLIAFYAKGELVRLRDENELINKLKNKFISLGGKLKLNSDVNKVEIVRGKATGIYVNDQNCQQTDAIISCIDPYNLYNRILEGKHPDRALSLRYDDYMNYPLLSNLKLRFNIKEGLDLPHDFILAVPKTKIATEVRDELQVSYDKDILDINIFLNNNDYKYYQILSKNSSVYEKEIADTIKVITKLVEEGLEKTYDIDAKIKAQECLSPIDIEKKYHRYQGNLFGFTQVKNSEIYISDGRISSISGIYLSPSWLERPCHILKKMINAKNLVSRMDKDLNK